MSELQTVSITIGILTACVSVVIGVINSIRSSREAKQQRQIEIQTRQAELFMQLYQGWSEPDMRKAMMKMAWYHQWDNAEDFMKKYGPATNLDEFIDTYVRQATFYEGIGVLVEMGLIDITLVDRLLHNTTQSFWKRMGPVYAELRKRQSPDEYPHYDSTEYLYNLVKNMGQQQKQQ